MAPPTRVQGVQITGPLAPLADDYRVKLREHGYKPRSIMGEFRHVARLSRWLEERQLTAVDLSQERLEQFLCELPRRRDGGRICSRRALIQVLEVLEEQGLERPGANEAPVSASEALLASFERFLLQERAVAPSTAAIYLARVGRFLAQCAPSGEVAGLQASDVTDAVLQESTTVSVSAAKLFVTALRSFLRFCFIEGLTPNDLSQAALAVARRRSSPLPEGIGLRAASALVRSCDCRRSKGRRDRAILLILLRLGLRAGEVAGLRLDDIDWRAGEVVVRGKGRREDRLPLLATSARPSPPTCDGAARRRPSTARCSCERWRRLGLSAPTGSPASCDAPVSGRTCRWSEPTASVTRLPAR
jgi:integrase/recombinase XerD